MFGLKSIRKLAANTRANVSMIFALSIVPIIGVAGFAIDAQLAFSKKEKVQYAIDSAVLAGARMMQVTPSQGKVKKHARAYFNSLIANEDNGMVCEDVEFDFVNDEELKAEVDCYQPTILMQVLGHTRVNFTVSSTATYGIGKLDVAFVFDLSGSMNNSGRLYNLKLAALDAVETLLPEPGSPTEGDVRIAMSSYNDMVNAGDFFEEVTGLKPRRTYVAEYTYEGTETVNKTGWHNECTCYFEYRGTCYYQRCESKYGPYTEEVTADVTGTEEYVLNSTCVYERAGDHSFSDSQPLQLPNGELVDRLEEGKLNASETPDNEEGFITAGYAYFQPYSQKSKRSAGDGGTWGTEGTNCRNVEPFELSSNELSIKSHIAGLNANNGTAGHLGIEWGWYLISEKWDDVFDGSAKPLPYDEPDSVKAMIIMTDGEFNSQYHGSMGNSEQQAKKLCDEIKKESVVIYTVAFDAPKKGEEVLAYCASGVEFAFKAKNGQELIDSYKAIASSISDLRIKY